MPGDGSRSPRGDSLLLHANEPPRNVPFPVSIAAHRPLEGVKLY